MFNEEIKSRFLRSYTENILMARNCHYLFKACEKYEREWGADLCTMDEASLQKMVDDIAGLRTRTNATKISILRDYVKWCIANNIPGACDGMLKIKEVGLDNIKTHMVSSPLHLQMYLDEICLSEDRKSIDNTYRCFYWLAYAGMSEADILSVRVKDVDLDNMSVWFNGVSYPIYREALQSVKNCARLNVFTHYNAKYQKDMPRTDGDLLLRGIKSNPTPAKMRTKLSRLSKEKLDSGKTNLQLSHARVWLSGIFYRAYERERIGIEISFRDAATQSVMAKAENSIDTSDAKTENTIRRTANLYLSDYKRWKMAFYS